MANKYFRKYLSPLAAAETAMYTVPAANTGLLSSLRVTNGNALTALIDVAVYPLGGVNPYYLIKDHCLTTNASMDALSGVVCVMEATDILKVTSSRADCDFYLSYLEVDRT